MLCDLPHDTGRRVAKIMQIRRGGLQIHVDDTAFPLIYSNMRTRLCARAISALAQPADRSQNPALAEPPHGGYTASSRTHQRYIVP